MLKSYKILILAVALLASNVFAQRLHGHTMGGLVGLGGFAKNLVVKDIFPLGTLVSAHGHEVVDFSKYPKATKHNKHAYCYSSMDFAIDANLFGFYFGGEASKVFTTGTCEMKPEALVGEDLVVFVSFDPGKGSKSLPLGVALNFGFSMDNFIEKMHSRFARGYLSERTPGERLKRLHTHIAKYLAKTSVKKSLTKKELLFTKLLTVPFLSRYTKDQNILSLITPSVEEIEMIRNFSKEGFKFSLTELLSSFYYKTRKDAEFYSCKDYYKCEEIYVDFLQFYQILIESFDDCGSINLYFGMLSEFSLKMTNKLKIEVGFGYSRTEHNKSYNSDFSTSILALGEFAKHNFSDQSVACEEVAKKVGLNFGSFLGFLQ